ncbi:MAG: hypothetical protein Q9159_007055 [Coniocarpon cinnabarinum]
MPIAPLFSLTNILSLEPFVDEVILVMFAQFDERFVGSQAQCNLGDWLQYFAFEVMATMTFSQRYGFLESGSDTNGLIEAIWRFMKGAAPFTQMPWLDIICNKNAMAARLRPPTGMPILKIALDRLTERRNKVETAMTTDDKGCKPGREDMLDHFLKAQITNPQVPEWAPTAWTFSNLIAGSDSTAAVMKTIWINLLRHEDSEESLRTELLDANLSRPLPDWAEVRDLTYLDACVNEAIRLHPPFCLPFERVVPKGGITVCGIPLPEGTVVGMNPWVVNRDRKTFGEDANRWRPERWIQCSAHSRKRMDQAIMTVSSSRFPRCTPSNLETN